MNLRQFLRCTRGPVVTADTTPNDFTFDLIADAELSTEYLSSVSTLTGFDVDIQIAAPDGCLVSINGGAFVQSGTMPAPSGTLQAKATSSASYDTPASFFITAGETVGNFVIQTKVDPIVPAQVWPQTSFSIKRGKLTRVGQAATDFGKQGGGTVTITGTNSSHWQWQDVGSKQNAGLAPKNGAAVWGAAWIASPADSYDLTLTDDTTGQSCTVHIDLAFTYVSDGMTYTAANCVSAGNEYDLFDTTFPNYGAPSYLKRTATDGGLVLLNDGFNVYGNTGRPRALASSPQVAAIGVAGAGGSDTGFVRGTWDDTFYSDGATKHGDKSTSRRIKGYNANYVLMRPESDFGATITRLQTRSTLKLQYCNVIAYNPANSANIFSITISGNDVCISDNYFDGERDGVNASVVNTQAMTFKSGSTCQNMVLKNNLSRAWSRWAVLTPWKCRVRNNLGMYQTEDWIRIATDTASGGEPYPADMSDNFADIADNIHFGVLSPTAGAHPDLFQHYNGAGNRTGATGPAVGGTLTYQRNVGITTYSQCLFGGGGDLRIGHIVYQNNIMMNRCSNIMSMHKLDTGEAINNTFLEDQGTDYRSDPETWSIPLVNSSCVNVTWTGNIYTDKSAPQFAMNNSGTKTTTPTSKVMLTTASIADYQAMFTNWPAADGTKDLSATAFSGITTYDAALAKALQLFTPTNLLETSGGAKRADGSYMGALLPTGEWNV